MHRIQHTAYPTVNIVLDGVAEGLWRKSIMQTNK